MAKKGIRNGSIEQVNKDHETETAIKVDRTKTRQSKNRK
jgi:hypothetical protein